MATIVTRSYGSTAKGSELTIADLDNTLIAINTELEEATADIADMVNKRVENALLMSFLMD